MYGLILQLQADGDFVGGERLRFEARAEVVENARDQEQQRLQQFHRMLQFDAVLIRHAGFVDAQRTLDGAARHVLQMDAFGSEALSDA